MLRTVLLVVVCVVQAEASLISSATAVAAGCYNVGVASATCFGADGGRASASITILTDGVRVDLDAGGAPYSAALFGPIATLDADAGIPFEIDNGSGMGRLYLDFTRRVEMTSGDGQNYGADVLLTSLTPIDFTYGVPFEVPFHVHAQAWADGGYRAYTRGLTMEISGMRVEPLVSSFALQAAFDAPISSVPEPTGSPLLAAALCTALLCRIGTRLLHKPLGWG